MSDTLFFGIPTDKTSFHSSSFFIIEKTLSQFSFLFIFFPSYSFISYLFQLFYSFSCFYLNFIFYTFIFLCFYIKQVKVGHSFILLICWYLAEVLHNHQIHQKQYRYTQLHLPKYYYLSCLLHLLRKYYGRIPTTKKTPHIKKYGKSNQNHRQMDNFQSYYPLPFFEIQTIITITNNHQNPSCQLLFCYICMNSDQNVPSMSKYQMMYQTGSKEKDTEDGQNQFQIILQKLKHKNKSNTNKNNSNKNKSQ